MYDLAKTPSPPRETQFGLGSNRNNNHRHLSLSRLSASQLPLSHALTVLLFRDVSPLRGRVGGSRKIMKERSSEIARASKKGCCSNRERHLSRERREGGYDLDRGGAAAATGYGIALYEDARPPVSRARACVEPRLESFSLVYGRERERKARSLAITARDSRRAESDRYSL